jgi:7,8-dihydroneopterin aldolase/epimerase/oxygenase
MLRMISFPEGKHNEQVQTQVKAWRILVKDLCVNAFLGIHSHEHQHAQPIRINIICDLLMPVPLDAPTSEHVFCYDQLVKSVTEIATSHPIYLVETLAERIADYCLADQRVQNVIIKVEKTKIYSNAESAGVEIVRTRSRFAETPRPAA